MNSPSLPLELLFLVIANIDPSSVEGRQCLSAFSMANHTFQVICQKRIFRKIEISYLSYTFTSRDRRRNGLIFEYGLTGQNFHKLLLEAPHIGPYVEDLQIKVWAAHPPADLRSDVESSESPALSLYAIVPRLSNLKRFSVLQGNICGWLVVTERMQDLLTTVASLVTTLDIFSFKSIPASIFSGCSNIQELHISTLTTENIDLGQDYSQAPVKLRVLQVELCSLDTSIITTWFNNPRSPLDISEIQSLGFSNPVNLAPHLNGLLALCSNELEELHFFVDLPGGGFTDLSKLEVNLQELTHLRYLAIRSTLSPRDRDVEAIPDQAELNNLWIIAAILKSIPVEKFQRLRQLRLQFDFSVSHLEDFNNDLALLAWFNLADVLEAERSVPYISEVEIRIRDVEYRSIHGKTSAATLALILDKNVRLKKLRERGLLFYGVF